MNISNIQFYNKHKEEIKNKKYVVLYTKKKIKIRIKEAQRQSSYAYFHSIGSSVKYFFSYEKKYKK